MKISSPIAVILLALLLCGSIPTLRAQDSDSGLPSVAVDTSWTGVTFKIMDIRHIVQNRLLVIIKIEATANAPMAGTLLGTKFTIPAALAKKPWLWDAYDDKPFSLLGATMTDELTGTQCPALSPVYPPRMRYFPSSTKETIRPGGYDILSIQFDTPPPPPPPKPGEEPKKQTLSFLFPNAVGPLQHVPLPPPAQPAAGATGGSAP